jgi:hypothetical protein
MRTSSIPESVWRLLVVVLFLSPASSLGAKDLPLVFGSASTAEAPDAFVTDVEPVILAGAYNGTPPDDPTYRVDPNTTASPFAGVVAVGYMGLFEGSGVLISPRHVLTAGHLIDQNHDGYAEVSPADLQVHLNFGGNSTHILNVSQVALQPCFTGFNNPALNDDLAILTLAADVPAGVPIYPLLSRPMQQGDVLTLVGYGRSGYGNAGFRPPVENFNIKRVGENVADAAFLDDEGTAAREVFIFDFDGPDETTNALGGLTLGNLVETTLGFGDSGGAAFIYENGAYKLAGINTFIGRFSGRTESPPFFGSAGGGVMIYSYVPWIAAQTGIAQDCCNVLRLDVQGSPAYLKPGQVVTVDMDALHLGQRVTGVQAFLNFDSAHFSAQAGDVAVAPGGGMWTELIYDIYNVQGDLDMAIGVDLWSPGGTDADGTAAIITLKATGEGTTRVVFRPDEAPCGGGGRTTIFSDESSLAVLPNRIDSQVIVIDGTPPSIAVTSPNGGEFLRGGQSYNITWTATDANVAPDSIELEYDDGNGWVTIATGEANDGSYAWSVPAINSNQVRVRVTASDLAGNTASDESDGPFVVDSVAPGVGDVSARQGGPELTPSGTAIQGLVTIVVQASDNLSGVAAAPTVTVTPNGGSAEPAAFVDESPAGTFSYSWTVTPATPNGTATIAVGELADRSGNTADVVTDAVVVNKNQITGMVELESFVGATRAVTFVARGSVTKSWTQTLSFASGEAAYTLTDVPSGATGVSAKTAWSLRRKLSVTLDPDGQFVANFTGAGRLLGGDLNGSNQVNVLDYSVLKANWNTPNDVADINGDGMVGTLDYSVLKANWFRIGDAE